GGPIRVVIAEDNALLRGVLRDALREAGFDVIGEATDGVEALALLAAGVAPDVFLMNGRMPNMDGWEATRRIVRSHPDLPVIMLSGTDDPRLIQEALDAGARCILKIGVGLDELLAAMLAAVATSHPRGPVTTRPIRVVIAEDNALLRGVLRDALREAGFDVIGEATDGAEALALLEAGAVPDVCVMDDRMPNVDGWEATKRIEQSFPDLPVLIHPAYAQGGVVERSRAAGARGLVKPGIGLDEFCEALRILAAGGTYGLDA
ncbi:MAG: hypothetical protein QOF27_1498, partial [Gaiellaceae bacterium]|nr:hypothetical protein [Gaiellaceae bacterium]